MAIQIESRGQLVEFLELLRRRAWQIVLPAAFVLALGSSLAVLVPKKYPARTQIELRPVGLSVSTKEVANVPFQLRAPARVKKVVQSLGNEEYLALAPADRNEFVRGIQDDVTVRTASQGQGGSSFVTIEYSDVDKLWAASFLEALRDDWIDDVIERERNKARDEERKLDEERRKLERQFASEQEGLAELLRKHGLSPTQLGLGVDSGSRGEDPTAARLQRNKAELERTQLQLSQNRVALTEKQKAYDEMPERLVGAEQVVAGRSNEADLQRLDQQILEVEKNLQDYLPQHSRYKQLKKRLAELEDQREQLSRIVTRSDVLSTTRPNPDREPLRREIGRLEIEIAQQVALEKQLAALVRQDEADVSRLHAVYSEANIRMAAVARRKETLAETTSRYQAKLEEVKALESSLSNPFVIIEPVFVPKDPTEPNPWMIVAFALVGGLGLGLVLALALEYSKNAFRSVHDISRVMVVPVLGTIETILTRRDRRLATGRRVVVAASSLVLIGALGFVTWAWAKNPGLLSPELRVQIELLRSKLR